MGPRAAWSAGGVGLAGALQCLKVMAGGCEPPPDQGCPLGVVLDVTAWPWSRGALVLSAMPFRSTLSGTQGRGCSLVWLGSQAPFGSHLSAHITWASPGVGPVAESGRVTRALQSPPPSAQTPAARKRPALWERGPPSPSTPSGETGRHRSHEGVPRASGPALPHSASSSSFPDGWGRCRCARWPRVTLTPAGTLLASLSSPGQMRMRWRARRSSRPRHLCGAGLVQREHLTAERAGSLGESQQPASPSGEFCCCHGEERKGQTSGSEGSEPRLEGVTVPWECWGKCHMLSSFFQTRVPSQILQGVRVSVGLGPGAQSTQTGACQEQAFAAHGSRGWGPGSGCQHG